MNPRDILAATMQKLFVSIADTDQRAQDTAVETLKTIPCISDAMIAERRDYAQSRYQSAMNRIAEINKILSPFYWTKKLATERDAVKRDAVVYVVACRLLTDVLKARKHNPPRAQRLVIKSEPVKASVPVDTSVVVSSELKKFGCHGKAKRRAAREEMTFKSFEELVNPYDNMTEEQQLEAMLAD